MFRSYGSREYNVYYKLIISYLPDNFSSEDDLALMTEFMKLYKKNNVLVIGDWMDENSEEKINYLITAYRDEAHYHKFVDKMKTNETYQKYSKIINKLRNKVEIKTLKLNTIQRVNLDEELMAEYLNDVRNQIEQFQSINR